MYLERDSKMISFLDFIRERNEKMITGNIKAELPKMPRGEGNLSLCNGRIRYQKTVNTDDRSVRLAVYGETVEEVLKLMKKREEEVYQEQKDKQNFLTGNEKLGKSIVEWHMQFKKEDDDFKDSSFTREYCTINNQILPYQIAKMKVKNITSVDVKRYFTELNKVRSVKTGKELSYSTKKKAYDVLNQYFRFYCMNNQLSVTPMELIKPPKKDEKKRAEEMLVLDDEEIQRFIAEASKPFCQGKSGYMHGDALIIMLWTFIRVGELIALRRNDYIDMGNGKKKLRIDTNITYSRNRADIKEFSWKETTPKTEDGKRDIELCQLAIDCIERRIRNIGNKDDYLFGSGNNTFLRVNNLEDTLRKILKRADIKKDLSLHGLRHTGISYFLRHGVPVEVVSRWAGHSSVQVTYNIYYSVIQKQKEDAIKLINQAHIELKGR